ncbi:hypothetical protein THRCLA_05444 [Thraustotheca clavata]|uniref:Uncharacterized protein n=1 Tax=Thraustotheca clavata TaxID=74557 RepID=A0A1V9ZVW5_9STRA|nr:hypothetical protein THRCLA_05444 [Thraustotheca clavata]
MSKWESIADVYAIIFDMAGPLTKYLSGLSPTLTEYQIQLIWCDVFQLNWDGDFKTLPQTTLVSQTFRCIQTRWMYEKAQVHFKHRYQHLVMSMVIATQQQRYFPITITPLEAAPMENVWLDELQSHLKNPITLANAAMVGGHLRLVKYLVEQYQLDICQNIYKIIPICGCSYRGLAMDIAAERGDLEMIKYLFQGGNRSFSKIAMDIAATNGHFDVVKWLHLNLNIGCTWRAKKYAMNNGHNHIIDYLDQHGLAQAI